MLRIPEHFYTVVYISALVLIGVSLPFSVFTLSVAQIILMVNWLLEGRFLQKWELLKQRPAIWIISLFYAVHLLGMIYTSDFSWGFHDLRIKLPLFVLPLVIGTSAPLNNKQLKTILIFFIGAVLVGSLYSAYIIFGGNSNHSVEQTSPFISHIRWSLMVDLEIFVMFWLFNNTDAWYKLLYIVIIMWLVAYVFLLQVFTGIVVLIVTSFILLIRSIFYNRHLMYRWFIAVLLFTIILIISSYMTHAYSRFCTFDKIDTSKIDKVTARGNPYYHDFTKKSVENGHYTYLYISDSELRDAWKKRSKLDFDGQTENKGDLKYVLMRYLTSKGLRKDSVGFSHLSNREIKFIESGITNYIDTNKYSIYPMIYRAMWELHNYKTGVNPSGYSISQRIEFVKTALHIIRDNFWFGVGTGDIPDAFEHQYITDHSQLKQENQLRTHNQLITFWVTFGAFGLMIILFSLIAPGFFEKRYTNYLFISILIIGFLSFLNEDTLETHTGISFFAFFYAIFLFNANDKT